MATIKNKNIHIIFRNDLLLFDSQIVIRLLGFDDSESGDCVHDIIVERNIIFKPDIILQTTTLLKSLFFSSVELSYHELVVVGC